MRYAAGNVVLSGLLVLAAAAGTAQSRPPQRAAAPGPGPSTVALELRGPALIAAGVRITLTGQGAHPGQLIRIERRRRSRWRRVGSAVADSGGRFRARFRPRRPARRYRLRAVTSDGRVSRPVGVRSRPVTLAATGDINLGNGPLRVMRRHGLRYPWSGVAPTLRRADIAFGNLECAISRRGRPVPKEFNFRGPPRALQVLARYAGFDVLNLANNHVGDYGRRALLDTVAYVRRFGMKAVGAGGSSAAAARPRVVRRLGLRVAFVGFSDILPSSFFAGPRRAGTRQATADAITRGVRSARRRADVVIATFHWGTERAAHENPRQRSFAATALRAGAGVVIGAHPHVLQPVRRRGRRLVAYSLGNFVFSSRSGATTRTGILKLELSTRGVERSRLLPARIQNTRPRLLGR